MSRSRIAVTGVGVVCAIGHDTDEFLEGLRSAKAGITPVERFDPRWAPCRVGGEVKDFRPPVSPPLPFELGRAEEFALAAAIQALEQSGLGEHERARYRVGVSIGTCQTSMGLLAEFDDDVAIDALRAFSAADAVAAAFGFTGPRFVPSNACAAGGAALAMARDQIWSGAADVMLAGGTDALEFFSWAGFSVLQSLDTQPCSPYGRSAGLNIGEGAAVFVLEPFEVARARGARILVELAGCGSSADGYHPTAPDPTGRGAALAMQRAMTQAGVDAADVDYVSGHGTGTPANDAMERAAFRSVLGERARRVPISSTKSQIGHTLGAAGAIEAAACVLAIQHHVLPPTINMPADAPSDFDFVPNASRAQEVRVAVSNNYAFGGSNSSLVFAEPTRSAPAIEEEDHGVLIAGLGAVGALGEGIDSWWDAFSQGRSGIRALGSGDGSSRVRLAAAAPELQAKKYASRNDWRKMNEFCRLCVASSRLAWDDSGLQPVRSELDHVALIFATSTGSMGEALQFDRLARSGPDQANPHLFPNVALNAAGGHVCTVLGIHGPSLSVTQGWVSSMAALIHAAGLIRRGEVQVAMVVSGDEFFEELIDATLRIAPEKLTADRVRPFDQRADGTALGTAAVTMILESEDHARARGVPGRAALLGSSLVGSSARLDDLSSAAWIDAMNLAVERSGIEPGQVGYCAAAASGINDIDRHELDALGKVFGEGVAVGAPKSMTGECFGTTAAIGVVASVLALQRGLLTPTVGLEQPLPSPDVNHVTGNAIDRPVEHCLVTASDPGASYASLVLGRAGR